MVITKAEVFRITRITNCPIGIRIHTDTGLIGDGEVALAYGRASNAAYGMLKDLVPLIVGMDPLDTEVIWNKIYNEIFWTQNGGPVVYGGISAIDMALWDIKGKAFKAPVYKLLGGKNNPRLRTYASQLQFYWGEWSEKGHSWAGMGTPEEFAENALRAVKEGYTALKFDLTQTDEKGVCMGFVRVGGLQSAEVLNPVESRMAAIREAVGPDIDILIENHGQTDTAAALQMAKRLEKYHPFAYEEPSYPSGEITGNIARQTGLPLAHGERLYNRWQFLPMLQSGALQLAQPDLGTCGGITEGKKICDLAQAYDCGVQLHICASNLSIAPALHLEAAIPNFTIHEHHVLFLQEDNKKLVRYDYQPVNGYYEVPDLPGLGNEWSDYAFSIAADYATLK